MKYFENDTESVTISGISIENGVGEIAFGGSVTLKRDAATVALLRKLREEVDALIAAASQPSAAVEEEAVAKVDTVDNPFNL